MDAEYRFLGADVGPVAQDHCKWKKKIKDGTLGLPEPLGERGPPLCCLLLRDVIYPLKSWPVKQYSRRQLSEERENTKLQDFQRVEGSGDCLKYL